MKKLLLLLCLLSPFLICDPPPLGYGIITDIQIRYVLNNVTVIQTGTYLVVGDRIQVYDFEGNIGGKSRFQMRWSSDNGSHWNDWVYAVGDSRGFWF